MNDRRKTGVNRTVLTDNDGGKVEVYNASAGKVQTWVTLFVGLSILVGIVFAAARTGVQIEVKDAIKVEAQEENGVIYQEIHGQLEEMIEEVQGVFQDDLDVFEKEQKTMGEAVIRLEVRQIGVIKKVDDQHLEVMTELRAIRDGG
jgi:hypothetical protein